MYDELLRKLYRCASEINCNKCSWTEGCSGEKAVIRQAADAIEYMNGHAKVLEKLADYWCERVPKWIPVTERLPDRKHSCLVCDDAVILDGYMNLVGEWYDFLGDKLKFVSHWMPLPQPPGKEDIFSPNECEKEDYMQKHGKWIRDNLASISGDVYPVVHCSECNIVGYWEPNYCPNCGARMDGGT